MNNLTTSASRLIAWCLHNLPVLHLTLKLSTALAIIESCTTRRENGTEVMPWYCRQQRCIDTSWPVAAVSAERCRQRWHTHLFFVWFFRISILIAVAWNLITAVRIVCIVLTVCTAAIISSIQWPRCLHSLGRHSRAINGVPTPMLALQLPS